MSKPENLVLLSDSQQNQFMAVAQPDLSSLQKQLSEKRKRMRRLEQSIVSKRQQLANFSNTLNKQVQRHLNTKSKQSSFLDVLRATETHPILKEKHDELVKVQAEIEQVKRKLEEIRQARETGPGQQTQSVMAIIALKNEEISKLIAERETIKTFVKRMEVEVAQETPNDIAARELEINIEAMRKSIKEAEKDVHKAEKHQQLFNHYSGFIETQIEQIERRAQMRRHRANPQAWRHQIQLIQKVIDEKIAFEKKIGVQVSTKIKKSQQLEAANNELKKKIRQLHNKVLRSQLDVRTVKRSVTQRTHSSDNLQLTGKHRFGEKRQRKTSLVSPITKPRFDAPDKIPVKIGNTQDSPSSIWITDKPLSEDPTARLCQILVYQSPKTTISGLQLKYFQNNQIISGKKMIAYTSTTSDPKSFKIQTLSSISFLYNDSKICAITFTPIKGQPQTIGTLGAGISRVITLNEFNLLQIEVKLEMQEDVNEMAIAGVIVTIEKKALLKKNTTLPIEPMEYIQQDIQISEELPENKQRQRWKSVSSQKNIIYKGSLPKLNVKKIVDHRLMVFQGGRR